jgi:hypothetical protein
MKPYLTLALGIILIVCALVNAIFVSKSQRREGKTGDWFSAYFGFMLASTVTIGLLLFSNLFVRFVSVNAYKDLFDGLSLALVGTILSGLILVVRRPKYLLGYFIFLCGAVITFGEFFGR